MNKGYVYDIPQDKFEEEKNFEWISMFFDGTGGNRYNVEMKTDYANNPAQFEEKLRQGKYGKEVTELSPKEKKKLRELLADNDDFLSSYNQEYTNITRLYQNYNQDEATEAIYQDGVGTGTGVDDNWRGGGFGRGPQGIVAKVETAIEEAVDRITQLRNHDIEKLGINVFGFSRGSACARYFIYKIFAHSFFNKTLKEKLEPNKKCRWIFVNFVGLFDTVSSCGYTDMVARIGGFESENNVKYLHLNEVARAKFTVQISAADEYRRNFSLTNINSCGFHGLQLSFPGAHCDVGGGERGYEGTEGRDKNKINADQEIRLLEKHDYDSNDPIGNHYGMISWKDKWIETGWYEEAEFKSEIVNYTYLNRTKQKIKLWGIREKISKKYSYVTLHIMAGLAIEPLWRTWKTQYTNGRTLIHREVKIDYDTIVNDKYKIEDALLVATKKALLSYTKDMRQKVTEKWGATMNVKDEKIIEQEIEKMYGRDKWLRGYQKYLMKENEMKLRHGYLHRSAKIMFEDTTCIQEDAKDPANLKNGMPYRNIYNG